MKNKPPQLIEHVARTICKTSSMQYINGEVCIHCNDDPTKCMWQSFTTEAEAAIDAVSDFAMISLRNKPKVK